MPPIDPEGGRQAPAVILRSSSEGARHPSYVDEDVICVAQDSRPAFFWESRTTSPSAAFENFQQLWDQPHTIGGIDC